MAKNNKYASINFNHIYEKSTTNPSSSSTKSSSSSPSPSYSAASYSAVSSNKGHGRMLVLTRPSPKPVSIPAPQPQQPSPQPQPKLTHEAPNQPQSESRSDAISLRPLGHTGPSLPSPVLNDEKGKELPPLLTSPKPDKFLPPHLRPGFVRREERSGPEMVHRQQGFAGSAGRYGEDRRPKSGGYDRMRRGGDGAMINRPRSSGSRPSSSGWN